jgi:hypothetical protein
MNTAIRLALGAAVASALVAAPAAAGGGWGYPGYRPPPPRYGGYYGGYHGGGNGGAIAAAAIGGLLFGGLLVAASQPRPQTYTVTTVNPGIPLQAVPAPIQPVPPPPPVYNNAPAAPAATAAQAQVDLCARAAERWAQGNGGIARVVAIQGITGDQANAEITGTLEIANAAPGQPSSTGFTCWASYGTVTGIKLG